MKSSKNLLNLAFIIVITIACTSSESVETNNPIIDSLENQTNALENPVESVVSDNDLTFETKIDLELLFNAVVNNTNINL